MGNYVETHEFRAVVAVANLMLMSLVNWEKRGGSWGGRGLSRWEVLGDLGLILKMYLPG